MPCAGSADLCIFRSQHTAHLSSQLLHAALSRLHSGLQTCHLLLLGSHHALHAALQCVSPRCFLLDCLPPNSNLQHIAHLIMGTLDYHLCEPCVVTITRVWCSVASVSLYLYTILYYTKLYYTRVWCSVASVSLAASAPCEDACSCCIACCPCANASLSAAICHTPACHKLSTPPVGDLMLTKGLLRQHRRNLSTSL